MVIVLYAEYVMLDVGRITLIKEEVYPNPKQYPASSIPSIGGQI
jgi:hypothetical protein